jgi:hypothetical protein
LSAVPFSGLTIGKTIKKKAWILAGKNHVVTIHILAQVDSAGLCEAFCIGSGRAFLRSHHLAYRILSESMIGIITYPFQIALF